MDHVSRATLPALASRAVAPALRAGWSMRCPGCHRGKMYKQYLKVADACDVCGEELHHQRADDAPPYFTIFIVAHIVVAGILVLERAYAPPTWLHLALWLPLTLALSLWLLPRVKGALIGLQWALRMHGFDPAVRAGAPDPTHGVGLTSEPRHDH